MNEALRLDELVKKYKKDMEFSAGNSEIHVRCVKIGVRENQEQEGFAWKQAKVGKHEGRTHFLGQTLTPMEWVFIGILFSGLGHMNYLWIIGDRHALIHQDKTCI